MENNKSIASYKWEIQELKEQKETLKQKTRDQLVEKYSKTLLESHNRFDDIESCEMFLDSFARKIYELAQE